MASVVSVFFKDFLSYHKTQKFLIFLNWTKEAALLKHAYNEIFLSRLPSGFHDMRHNRCIPIHIRFEFYENSIV